jgi:hypothetical protein
MEGASKGGKKMLGKRFYSICAWQAALVMLATTLAGAAERPVLDILKEKAGCIREICDGQLITFTMLTQAGLLGPDQGNVTKEFSALWEGETLYMKAISTYQQKPTYVPLEQRPHEGIDYREGDLIIWRTPEAYMLSSPTRNESVSLNKVFHVQPDGTVKEMGGSKMKSIYKTASSDGTYDYYWFEMTMGRGGSRSLLKTIKTEKDASTGMTQMLAEGSLGTGLRGQWKLVIDPNCDHLVREALLRKDPNSPAILKTTCSGTAVVDGRVVCASSGTLAMAEGKFGACYENVKITRMSDKEREAFKQEVITQIDSDCTKTMDMRGKQTVMPAPEKP